METRAQLGAVPRTLVVLATLALLTGLAAGAIAIGASTGPKLPPPFGVAGNGLIAFVSHGDIYGVQPDGSGLKQLTSGPGVEYIPTWSRDGRKLAFWSGPEVSGPADLVVVDADGENAVTVARTSGSTRGSGSPRLASRRHAHRLRDRERAFELKAPYLRFGWKSSAVSTGSDTWS